MSIPRKPFVPIAGCTKVELMGTDQSSGRPIANVFHALSANNILAADLLVIATAVENWWYSSMRALMSSSYRYDETRCTDLTTSSSAQVVKNTVSGTFATGGPGAPSSIACLVSLHTVKRGHSHTGRVFVSPIPYVKTATGINSLDSTYVSDMAAAWTTLDTALEAITPTGSALAVASKKLATVDECTSVSVASKLSTQRRRMLG